ncbi:MAG: cation transporter [Clostridia bacterium]|nr:cation transporter [Clostridia bacterium]
MTEKSVKKYIEKRAWNEIEARERLGVTSGIVGIICNVILCVFKFLVGAVTNSVSITADAMNNLSDAGSNIVTIAGAKLSNKPVDKEHPFGHGRMEYISALVVAFLIFMMGFELAKSSVEKILNPEEIKFSVWNLIILAVAALIKLWMAYFNHTLYKVTDNLNLKAIKKDCINDGISTVATMVALVVSRFTSFKAADSIIGLFVSVIIIFAGINIVKEIIGPLLGQAPSAETVKEIEALILKEKTIIGIHDLIIHDYGPGRRIASVHAEVPSDVDIVEVHDLIDNIETEILEKMNILICIHMDPIVVDDEQVNHYKEITEKIIKGYNPDYGFHDFKMVKGPSHTNLIFDLVVPLPEKKKPSSEILSEIEKCFKAYDSTINLVVRVEHSYV